ncbi:MAG: phosphoribosylanthranilate isomerase [Lachnospiraceae bacterium]|nr:phosphoribosylanthranilate isomerase [Lachnospiraceae bacterium]
MTRIKLCGIRRITEIDVINTLKPDYVGFVFAPKSKRAVTKQTAEELRLRLHRDIKTVGVFVDEELSVVTELLQAGIIDIAQLHGHETEEYIGRLKDVSGKPVIRALRIRKKEDLALADTCAADHILLDAGAGDGVTFDWTWLQTVKRPYFLAGGLNPENVGGAVQMLRPFGVDVSSGIETDGVKDFEKMRAFVEAVRQQDEK